MLKRTLNLSMLLITGITIWLIWAGSGLKFDYNFEHFFPVESDDAEFYYAHREQFGSDNEFLMIGIREPDGILTKNHLTRLDSLDKQIRKVDHVKQVVSIANTEIPVINSFGVISIPAIRYDTDSLLNADLQNLSEQNQFEGSLISPDKKALCIYVRHDELLPKPASDSMLTAITQLVEKAGFTEARITGKVKSEIAYLNKTRYELIIFMSVSALLVVVFLWFTFRNIWGVVVPVSVVLLSIVWTIGIMTVTGKAIDIMIILMPCILFVVGMSDVIHITSQFYEKVEEGLDKFEAIKVALKEVGFATFLTCVSTMVAFLTLNTTSIQPIRDFGTYTAIGVAIAYVLSITILPWILIRVKNPDQFKIHTVNVKWDRFLRKLLLKVYRYPLHIAFGTVIILGLSAWGISRIEINNSVLDDLDEDDPIKQDFVFFDDHFGGVRGFEMSVQTNDKSSLLTWGHLKELEKLEKYLRDSAQVGAIVSPVQLVKIFNQATHDAEPEWFKMPNNEEEFNLLIQKVKPYLNDKQVRLIVNRTLNQCRIAGRIKEKGSKAVQVKNAKIENWLKSNSSNELAYRITGSSDLIDKSNLYLTQNMLEGLSLDVAVLMLIIGLIFKSWRMMLLSVLPNIIPLFVVGGLMGWVGVEMKVTISIIFSIAFGIAVDDTLHVLSRLKVELDKGYSLPMAMRITFLSTGKAMILTAMVIASGFSTLMLSDFKSTFYVGLLISLTLIIALIAELVLMPVLVIWIYGKKYRKKKIDR
jgi:predicted RND superfamily exporter protein